MGRIITYRSALLASESAPDHRFKEYVVSSEPLKVAVTGAAGQIGYSLLFRLASGVAGR